MQKIQVFVPNAIKRELDEYCRRNQVSISNLIRKQIYKVMGINPATAYLKPGRKAK